LEKIIIEGINKCYGEKIVFKDFSITFFKNQINTIIGKSGCGKSTLLNIISGILNNDSNFKNDILDFGVSYIFQDDRLVEWLSVEENLKLILKKNMDKDFLCDKYLSLVKIKEYKNYYPKMLSGGIRQRVNIARGLMYPANIILMDEPFKSIDVKNKMEIMQKIKEIENRTIIFVTHDMDEALFLSDKIFILGESPLKVKNIVENIDNLSKEKLISMM
jgi:NitT/TauT family transport system ATP-binding protein